MLHVQNVQQVSLHRLQGLHCVFHALLGTMPINSQQNVQHALLDQQLPSQEHLSASNATLGHFLLNLPHLFAQNV
jgi:hypothetical protein